jgi:hypothetical protein
MSSKFTRIVTLATVVIASVVSTAAQKSENAASIVGSWEMAIAFHDCGDSTPSITAPGLISFIFEGTLQEYGTGQPIPRNRTNAFGNWHREQGRTFSAVAKAFRFATDGTLAGTAKLYRTIELSDDGDSFIAEARAEIYDLNGNPVPPAPGRGCATELGTRIR